MQRCHSGQRLSQFVTRRHDISNLLKNILNTSLSNKALGAQNTEQRRGKQKLISGFFQRYILRKCWKNLLHYFAACSRAHRLCSRIIFHKSCVYDASYECLLEIVLRRSQGNDFIEIANTNRII